MEQLISIIVPVYNAESTLDRCITALIGQTYQNIEIILINDGSKDRSLDICRKYESKDDRIKVIDKPNGGVSSARNAGLDAASGAFIMFCDSDDWAEQDWCEELVSHYEKGCLVMCGHYIEGEQNFLPHEIRAKKCGTRYSRRDFWMLKLCNFNAPWNKIYDRSVICQGKLKFCENLTNGEDVLFILQYLNHISGDILFLDRCVFHYEWPRECSLSRRVPEDYLIQCRLMTNEMLKQCEYLGLEDAQGKQHIFTDRYNEFQKVILSILHDRGLTERQRIRKLTEVVASPEYQLCASGANISPNKVYCWLARRKQGFGLWLWHKVRK